MSVATADLLKAFNVAWNASNLDTLFKSLGGEDPVLNDQEATPGQSLPYCVMEQPSSTVLSRMSGGVSGLRDIRDIDITLNIHAGVVTGDSRTAKEIAGYLAEEVMKVFGGHPSSSPSGSITLDNGNHLITRYLSDYPIRTGNYECQWVINYSFRVDVPMTA